MAVIAGETKEGQRLRCDAATVRAQQILRKGDRIRCTKCPGTERTFTFDHWDGQWMVSKSGISDYHPVNISKVNGVAKNFNGL